MRKKIVAALGAAMMVAGATQAAALTFAPNPPKAETPITITSHRSDLEAGKYRVSVCTTERFGIGIPACADLGNANEFTHAGGQLKVTLPGIPATKIPNAHYGIGLLAQKPTFDCNVDGLCEVIIVKHDVFPKKEIERAPITIHE